MLSLELVSVLVEAIVVVLDCWRMEMNQADDLLGSSTLAVKISETVLQLTQGKIFLICSNGYRWIAVLIRMPYIALMLI